MPKRQRIDSATAAVKVMAGATGELLPPAHANLRDEAMPFWREIVRGRARAEWEETPALMMTAANLAWVQWQITDWRQAIESQTFPAGLNMAQAMQRLSDLQRLEMAYLRTLQQHARGAQGEARDAGKRRELTKAIEAASPFDDDELLARPQAH